MSNSSASDGERQLPSLSSLLDNTVTSQQKFAFITHMKIVKSGKLLEVYEYDKPIYVNHHNCAQKLKLLSEAEMMDILVNPEKYGEENDRSEEYKERSIRRSQTQIRRVVQCNFDKPETKLLTLTFKNTNKFDITSPKACYSRFAYFIRKLRRDFQDFIFLSVIEFQQRGAVHYHLIINLPYVPVEILRQYWRYGFLKINQIKNPALVGAYVAKYIGKALRDPRLKDHRCFSSSKNLIKPTTYYGDYLKPKINTLESVGYLPEYTNTYPTQMNGQAKYSSYNLYKPPARKEEYNGQ